MGTFVRLAGLPTVAAVLAWVVLFKIGGDAADLHRAAGLIPLVGCVGVPTCRDLRRDGLAAAVVGLHVFACVVFAILMLDLADAIAREPEGAFIPIFHYGLAYLLPFLAAGCGMAAVLSISGRDRR